MFGVVTAFANIAGALTGLLPKGLELYEKRQNHKFEREREDAQHKMQLALMDKQASVRTIEAENNLMIEEVRALRDSMRSAIEAGARPSGIAWIDGWNAALRPAFVSLVMSIFAVVAIVYVMALLQSFRSGGVTPQQFIDNVWGSFIGFSIEATIGYLFGYRNVIKSLGK